MLNKSNINSSNAVQINYENERSLKFIREAYLFFFTIITNRVSSLILYKLSVCLSFINAYFCSNFTKIRLKLNPNRASITPFCTIEFLLDSN